MNQPRRARGWWRFMPPLALGALVLAGAGARPDRSPETPRRHIVEIRGMAFQPAVLELAPGDTVVWINRDIVPHTATAAQAPRWGTGNLLQGGSGRFVARTSGAVSYFCELHPVMKGTLVVR